MTMYKIAISRRADKEIDRLRPKDRQRVFAVIDRLREDPFSGKQLNGDFEGQWAIRVWPYRIIYIIEKKIVTVTVLRVGHRQGVYKQ